MKLLIKTNAENWDESQIVAQGLMRDGFPVNSTSTTMTAGDLPEPYLTVWHGIVETLRGDGIADGGRACVMAEATLEQDFRTIDGEAEEFACVQLTTCWQWQDGRMTSDSINIENEHVVSLVEYLLNEQNYKQ